MFKENLNYEGLYIRKPYTPDKFVLTVPVALREDNNHMSSVGEKLGWVFKKNDERWGWLRFRQKTLFRDFSNGELKEGVEPTAAAAMQRVLEGLPERVDTSNITYRDQESNLVEQFEELKGE